MNDLADDAPTSRATASALGEAEIRLRRAYYQAPAQQFMSDDTTAILGALVEAHGFAVETLQRNAWQHQIRNLKPQLLAFPNSQIFFEFAIPRMGKRVDVLLLIEGIIFVVEYKVGLKSHQSHAIDQALDYAVDLKNFHEGSHTRKIVPVLVATAANDHEVDDRWYEDQVAYPQRTNATSLSSVLSYFVDHHGARDLDAGAWTNSTYKPTPTICEAAQALYAGHNVSEISRSDAGAINLSRTANCIAQIISQSKANRRKSICFVTGVPGSGKTLAGLNIASQQIQTEEDEHAVFLSGNGPLVTVLREALARDEVERSKASAKPDRLSKKAALSKASAFIQNIHHFRDENLRSDQPPIEKVVLFDEAQRAWSLHQASRFMREKRGLEDFSMSEPSFLLSVMDRHPDWCAVICLIGGGQEINTGEAGLAEWFDAIRTNFRSWDVHVSKELSTSDHFGTEELLPLLDGLTVTFEPDLHLSVSVRSFRSEKVSAFVHALIEGDSVKAKQVLSHLHNFPIVLTRDLDAARSWLKAQARGSERFGLVASSNAQRLKALGVDIRVKIDPANWFLNDKDDVRSSYFMEDVATEFDIQGLELDWVGVCWDANFRREDDGWGLYQFKGSRWMNVNDASKQAYLKNAYRVLLTRARQGMVICIPEGNAADPTRKPEYYDPIYRYLRSCGLPLI